MSSFAERWGSITVEQAIELNEAVAKSEAKGKNIEAVILK